MPSMLPGKVLAAKSSTLPCTVNKPPVISQAASKPASPLMSISPALMQPPA